MSSHLDTGHCCERWQHDWRCSRISRWYAVTRRGRPFRWRSKPQKNSSAVRLSKNRARSACYLQTRFPLPTVVRLPDRVPRAAAGTEEARFTYQSATFGLGFEHGRFISMPLRGRMRARGRRGAANNRDLGCAQKLKPPSVRVPRTPRSVHVKTKPSMHTITGSSVRSAIRQAWMVVSSACWLSAQ